MKKIIFSICALAAIAACTKSEVQYEPSGEISFAPVAKTLTKSVAGYYYGADNDSYVPKDANGNVIDEVGKFDGVFPTGINLYVFANAQDEDSAGKLLDTWKTPYFKNALFVHNADKGTEGTQTHPTLETAPTTGAYAGQPTRYWPNVKTLKFAGYSDACNVSGLTPTMNADFSALTINGYIQDNTKTAEGANDLMWFPATQAYGKRANEIPVQMKHACSWITVKVKTDGKFLNVKLHDLTINELYKTGTATCGAAAATWAVSGSTSTENLFANTNGKEVGTNEAVYENTPNNMIVIPQTPTTINVTYSYTSDENLTCKETVTGLNLKISEDTNKNKWESGVHYIYTITITATEILIDPVVVAWTEYDYDSTANGNQPIPVTVQ